MTDTRRAEFVEALNYLKLCSVVVGVAEGRRGRAEQTQKRDEEEATERVLAMYDALSKDCKDGWDAFSKMRKQVASERWPDLTGTVHANGNDAATAVQGGEPVAWRYKGGSQWYDAKSYPIRAAEEQLAAKYGGFEFVYSAGHYWTLTSAAPSPPQGHVEAKVHRCANCDHVTELQHYCENCGDRCVYAAPPAARQDVWQPIETAPLDKKG